MKTSLFMPFGRYSGRAIDTLPNAYLRWLSGLDDVREPLKTAIEMEIEKRALMAAPEPEAPKMDVKFTRDALRKLGRKSAPVEIVQTWGLGFVVTFCALAKITVIEFLVMAQLSPRLVNAEVFSTIAQRWCASWAAGIEREIKSADDAATFDTYAARFESRQAALEHLAAFRFRKTARRSGQSKNSGVSIRFARNRRIAAIAARQKH